jgi:glyoxylase-like metal-dependent hydrolase (beta-lactamase superfamily II)
MSTTTTSRIAIDDFEVIGLTDGRLATSLDLLIDFDRQTAERLVDDADNGNVFIPVNSFLIRRPGSTVLIDAGAGSTLQPTTGKLLNSLNALGIDPATITHIFLTHMHPDHFNGLVDDHGRAVFPTAEVFAHAAEIDFWTRPAKGREPDAVARNRERAKINLAPYSDRLSGLRDGEERLGLSPILAPGHTPGHSCWRIGRGSDALIAWGDIVHFPDIQIEYPDAAISFDLDKELAVASRKRIFDIAATERIAVAGAHMRGAGFGRVVRDGAGYSFLSDRPPRRA